MLYYYDSLSDLDNGVSIRDRPFLPTSNPFAVLTKTKRQAKARRRKQHRVTKKQRHAKRQAQKFTVAFFKAVDMSLKDVAQPKAEKRNTDSLKAGEKDLSKPTEPASTLPKQQTTCATFSAARLPHFSSVPDRASHLSEDEGVPIAVASTTCHDHKRSRTVPVVGSDTAMSTNTKIWFGAIAAPPQAASGEPDWKPKAPCVFPCTSLMTAAEIGLSSKPAVKLPPTAKTADDDVAVHQGMEKRCNLEKDTGTASWRCSQAKNVSTSQPTEQRRVAREYHHRIAVPRIACRSKSPDYSKSARTPQAIQPPPAESAFHCPRPPSVDPDGTGVEMSLIGSLFDLTQAVQALQDIRDTDQDSHTPSAARLVHDTQRSLTGEESDHTSSDAVSSDTLAISPLYSLADFLALAQPAKEDAKPTMCTSPVDVISVSIHDSCSAPPSLILDTECDIDDIEWGIDICPEAAQPDGEVQTSEVEDWIMLSPDELTDPSTRDEEAIKKAGRQETLVCTTFATAPLTSTARNPIESIKGTGNAASSASKKQALPNKFHSLFHADAIETTPDVGNSRTSTFNLVCGPRDRS